MKSQRALFAILGLCIGSAPAQVVSNAEDHGATVRRVADGWRREHRIIDLHQHIDCTPEHLVRAAQIMDRVGIGIAGNLSGGTTTHQGDKPSEFGRNKELADQLFPGRFIHYMNLDYTGWDQPDFSERAVGQIEEGNRLGAAGFKEYKRLGLYLRDGAGKLIQIDDPKLDPVWKRCGELGLPVSIHVADPKAFWLPYNEANERWKELKNHRNWWFGDTNQYPPHEELLAALSRVIARHLETTFVCVHFANNAEDLDWVEQSLEKHPNMMADLAARIPEIGRHDAGKVRRLFVKYQDRILFATDFQVYNRLTLGSGGSGPPPTEDDAVIFFLYVGYQCPFTEITVFTPPDLKKERFGLWERDVVEAFISTDPDNARHYYEFEVSPIGERLDLELGGASKNLDWNSGFESVARVNKQTRVWTVEMRLPLAALAQRKPVRGTRWRLNLYRHDLAHQAFLAWSPTATSTAHTPAKFGYLDFEE